MLWYKLNGTWQTWDYLHNTLGYSESATYAVSYKQASQANWGQSYTGDGYHDGSQSDYTDGLFWADGKVGWYDLNGLAETCELYPSDAIIGPTFTNNGQTSNSVFVRNSQSVEHYLIQADLQLGWVTVEEAADAGWNITEREKTSICGVLTATSDEVVEVETPYQLEVGTISFTGELRENVIPGSGTVEEYAPHIIVLLGLKYRSGAFSLENFNYTGSNNYWWSGFVDADNKQAALDFGCSAISNVSNPCPLQNLVYQPDTFNYEILGLYSDIDGTIPVTEFDLIDFSVTGSGTAEIFCSKQYSSSITAMTWRCKITKK